MLHRGFPSIWKIPSRISTYLFPLLIHSVIQLRLLRIYYNKQEHSLHYSEEVEFEQVSVVTDRATLER
jgi:hypothetical protein